MQTRRDIPRTVEGTL